MKRVLIALMLCLVSIIGFVSCSNNNSESNTVNVDCDNNENLDSIPKFDSTKNVFNPNGLTWYEPKSAPEIDSTKINELLPYFDVRKDEFDPNGLTWYEPKSAPKYTNRNGIYLYYSTSKDGINSLRFRIQYYADNWLFFKKIQFSIDSSAYEYVPRKTETDHSGGYIWEWFDEALNKSDKELINALANAKSAKMKFIGRQYYDIRNISKEQITDIKRTIELYKAMGGIY